MTTGKGLQTALKSKQFVSTITLNLQQALILSENGRSIINLDELASNVEINIASISNEYEGHLDIYIIGSDTYSCSLSASTITEIQKTDIPVPIITGGEGNVQRLFIKWGYPLASGDVEISTRLTAIETSFALAPVLPISPSYIAGTAEIGGISADVFTFQFDRAVNMTGVTGISFTASGGALSAVSVISGVNTDTPSIQLNRLIGESETVTFSVAGANDIEAVYGSVAFNGVTDEDVVTPQAVVIDTLLAIDRTGNDYAHAETGSLAYGVCTTHKLASVGQLEYVYGTTLAGFIGLDLNSTHNNRTTPWKFAVSMNNSGYQYLLDGVSVQVYSSVPVLDQSRILLKRNALNEIVIEYYVDGINLTDSTTFTETYTGNLFAKIQLAAIAGSSNVMKDVVLTGFTSI